MKLKLLPYKAIKPYKNNPRINDKAILAVKESIERYGYNVPIVVDAKNVIVLGHTRYAALGLLGYTEVHVIEAELSGVQARQFRIADNKTSERAEWDTNLLVDELRAVEGVNSSMAAFFADGELERLMAKVVATAPNSPSQETITKAAAVLGNKYEKRGTAHTAAMQEMICQHCGEKFFLEKV